MPYNDAFTKMVGDTSATFKTEITALQDNVTAEIDAPVLEGGKYNAKGDLNEIIQEIVNNDVILKKITDAIAARQDSAERDIAIKADKSIRIQAGLGLTGGGNLAADRTLNVSLSSEVSSKSEVSAATPAAVKKSYDVATSAEALAQQNAAKISPLEIAVAKLQYSTLLEMVADTTLLPGDTPEVFGVTALNDYNSPLKYVIVKTSSQEESIYNLRLQSGLWAKMLASQDIYELPYQEHLAPKHLVGYNPDPTRGEYVVGDSSVRYPASTPKEIYTFSQDRSGLLTAFSDYGFNLPKRFKTDFKDIVIAPGVERRIASYSGGGSFRKVLLSGYTPVPVEVTLQIVKHKFVSTEANTLVQGVRTTMSRINASFFEKPYVKFLHSVGSGVSVNVYWRCYNERGATFTDTLIETIDLSTPTDLETPGVYVYYTPTGTHSTVCNFNRRPEGLPGTRMYFEAVGGDAHVVEVGNYDGGQDTSILPLRKKTVSGSFHEYLHFPNVVNGLDLRVKNAGDSDASVDYIMLEVE